MSYFISGIDTGVGKSLVTAALAHATQRAAFKPLISGYIEGEENDASLLAHVTGQSIEMVSPWRYAAPLSPHLAAAKEGRVVDVDAVLHWSRDTISKHPDCLIEGVGGLLVPLHNTWCVIDWIAALNIPVILVSSSYLGAINHTLMSLEVLAQRHITPHCVIVSQADSARDAGLNDTADTLRSFLPQQVPLHTLPRIADSDTSWKEAANLLSSVL